jgi:hypothetical protein
MGPAAGSVEVGVATMMSCERERSAPTALGRVSVVDSISSRDLYVARDEFKTLVATFPLETRGKIQTSTWAGVTVLAPDTPTLAEQRPKKSNAPGVLVFLTLCLVCWAGTSGSWLVAVLCLVTGVGIASIVAISQRPVQRGALIEPPSNRSTEWRSLRQGDERIRFDQAIVLAERVSKTWPALGTMIDTSEAQRILRRALWDMGDTLVRRQVVSRAVTDLKSEKGHSLSSDSPLVERLHNTRREAEQRLQAIDVKLADYIAHLQRAAEAGERYRA